MHTSETGTMETQLAVRQRQVDGLAGDAGFITACPSHTDGKEGAAEDTGSFLGMVGWVGEVPACLRASKAAAPSEPALPEASQGKAKGEKNCVAERPIPTPRMTANTNAAGRLSEWAMHPACKAPVGIPGGTPARVGDTP
jgi:hypothetical protein